MPYRSEVFVTMNEKEFSIFKILNLDLYIFKWFAAYILMITCLRECYTISMQKDYYYFITFYVMYGKITDLENVV